VHALEREIGTTGNVVCARSPPFHQRSALELRACRVQQKDIEELNQVDLNG